MNRDGGGAAVSAVVVTTWLKGRERFGRIGFYVLFALSVTVSVQLVGIFLVFASLIVPALATRNLKRYAVGVGYGVGVAGYLLGLILSAQFDLPTGAVIVWALGGVAVLSSWLIPARWSHRVESRHEIAK